ncbi:MAG: AEC family transporter [Clostridia bacterium]|nr:AEC family transporter [Clostridia bacterium]
MELFLSTMGQMAYLFTFIFLGFVLGKCGAMTADGAKQLSKLENNLLIPAMVLNTFLQKFTVETLSTMWKTILYSLVVMILSIPFALLFGKLLSKDGYMRKIYTFGLSFSNFAFMGYAVVKVLFPEIYFEYVIFTLVLWAGVYVWGMPELLIAEEGKKSFSQKMRSFCNPIFICMLLGMIFGLLSISKYFPQWSMNVIADAEKCMAPLAMLLTGITLAFVDLKSVFSEKGIYLATLLRLLFFPLVFLLIAKIFHFDHGTGFLCALCSLAMPMSLSSIVIPAAYGKDTSLSAGMVLISHLLSCLTIPLIFLLL